MLSICLARSLWAVSAGVPFAGAFANATSGTSARLPDSTGPLFFGLSGGVGNCAVGCAGSGLSLPDGCACALTPHARISPSPARSDQVGEIALRSADVDCRHDLFMVFSHRSGLNGQQL